MKKENSNRSYLKVAAAAILVRIIGAGVFGVAASAGAEKQLDSV